MRMARGLVIAIELQRTLRYSLRNVQSRHDIISHKGSDMSLLFSQSGVLDLEVRIQGANTMSKCIHLSAHYRELLLHFTPQEDTCQ